VLFRSQQIVFPPDQTAQPSELGQGALGSNTSVSLALVRAAYDAFHLRCRSILWPVCCGSSIDDLFKATEIANLVNRLVAIDQPGSLKDLDLAIRTPFADMSREQIADLAFDLDAPTECCWAMRTPADELPPTLHEAQKLWQEAIRLAARLRGWEASIRIPAAATPGPGAAFV